MSKHEEEYEILHKRLEALLHESNILLKRYIDISKKLNIAVEALKFYADHDSWVDISGLVEHVIISSIDHESECIGVCGGLKARQALKFLAES